MLPTSISLQRAVDAIKQGGIICYPTEAVFGLGCDPDNQQAINRLLTIKARPKEKGLILVASHWSQLSQYVDFDALSAKQRERVLSSWPAPITWVIPSLGHHPLLTGKFSTLAVRVSAHPAIQQLCQLYNKPIVSTSANITGQPPALTTHEAKARLGDKVDVIVEGDTSGLSQPSTIIDALTGETLRV